MECLVSLLIENAYQRNKQIMSKMSITEEVFNRAIKNIIPDAYVGWFVRELAKGGQSQLDENTLKFKAMQYSGHLKEFDSFKHKLAPEQRDINRLALQDLVDLVDAQKNGLNQVDATDENDYQVIYQGPYGNISTPNTEQGAIELGRGTKWCTAATESENQFEEYNRNGRLYVIKVRSGEKYQFQFETGEYKDAQNEDIPEAKLIDLMEKYPPILTLVSDHVVQIEGDLGRDLANLVRDALVDVPGGYERYIAGLHEYVKTGSKTQRTIAAKRLAEEFNVEKHVNESIQDDVLSSDDDVVFQYVSTLSEKLIDDQLVDRVLKSEPLFIKFEHTFGWKSLKISNAVIDHKLKTMKPTEVLRSIYSMWTMSMPQRYIDKIKNYYINDPRVLAVLYTYLDRSPHRPPQDVLNIIKQDPVAVYVMMEKMKSPVWRDGLDALSEYDQQHGTNYRGRAITRRSEILYTNTLTKEGFLKSLNIIK